MNSYILFTILIGLGASQIVVTSQNICGCTQLTNQNDCGILPGCIWVVASNQCQQNNCSTLTTQSQCLKASYYCQWNPNTNPSSCSAFTSCASLTATNNQQCIQQNVRCLGYGVLPNSTSSQCLYYSEITSNCSDYQQNNCSYNFGKDGPCYWTNDNICQVINQCSQAQKQNQCEQLNYFKSDSPQGIVCQWNGTTCSAITNCNQFTTEDTCKHYFSNLNSITLNVCAWSQGQCVNVNNINQLNSQNCITNTGLLFRWYGLQQNPGIGFCGPCKQLSIKTSQISIITKARCICSDFVLSTDCNSQNSLCQWNAQTGTCSQSSCDQIKNQSICTQVSNCFWSFKTNVCQNLNSCNDLIYNFSAVGCAAQSLSCAGYEGNSCIATSTIKSTCSSQKTQTDCSQFIGVQGLCVWNATNNSCSLLQVCNQISDAAFCGNWKNQCQWNAQSSQCQQLECTMYSNEQTCSYVINQFTEYQLCRWNKTLGLKGGCENAYSALLQTSQTCVSNTGSTFRWSTNNASAGMCVSCGTNQLSIQTPSSCQCSQLYSKENCQNSGFCTYNSTTNICSPSSCLQYDNQITCASLSTCYWSSKNGCVPFTNCSSLTATNQLECVNMNASCKGFSNGTCQSFPTTTCSVLYAANGQCFNNIGTDGVCILNTTGQTKTCVGFSQCTQATNETLCLRNQFSCSWNNGTCSQVNCSSFKTQLNCQFYLPNPLSSQVVPCLWNTTTNTCGPASDILTQLTQNNCAASTHNTYSWVTVSATNNKGYCVRCQEQVTLPKQCGCTFLSQFDCSQALQCYWTNGSCQTMNCSQILQQTVCASQTSCYWSNNQCQDFVGSCDTLLGKSQAACMAQNVYCVGSNGTTCSQSYNKCEANTLDTSCVASLGSDGACYWNSTTNTCVAVNSCNQLPESACKLRSKSCYWDITSCQTLTCSTLYSQFGQCTFVMNLSSISYVQSCKMVQNECISISDTLGLTQDQCFTNSNRTARWVPKTKGEGGICYSCSANLTPIYSAQTCQCYQYMTQNECHSVPNQSCVWANSKCTEKTCASIFTNLACAQTMGCGWNSTTNVCENFTSCNSITVTGLAIQNCLSYSIQCKGYNGTNCTQYPNYTCGSLTTSPTCSGNLGTDGACLWVTVGETSSCVAITQCNQINSQQICSYYSNVCIYLNKACQQLTCANFTSPASCRYVVTSFTTGDIQQCQWSTSSNSCIDLITSSQLNSINCSTNTGFTYRWVPTKNGNGDGYCTKCVINSLYVPGQCACNQLIYQNDCQANLQCSWSTAQSTPSCYNKPCSQILQQAACSSNPRCQWSASQSLCQPFSSCSDLAGVNAGECASYSIYCAAISTTFLTLQQKYICASTASQQCSVQTATSGKTDPSECENKYVSYGICQYNATTSQCQKITMCSEITSQMQCQRLVHSCYWQLPTGEATTGSCVATKCSYITNKLECTYVLSSLTTPSASSVTQCTWQPSNGCQPAANILTTLSSSQCYSNTLMMSRWTSTSGDTGYCASCTQYSLTTTLKSVCSCSDLSSYECAYASPQCTYNQTSTKCVTQTCTSITSKYSCAANPNCIYVGTCQQYTKSPSSTTYGCVNITTATSSFDCTAASVNCPQFTPNTAAGKPGTCGVVEQCSKLNSTTCSTAAPYCVLNNNSCQTINNCKQITDIAICSLQTNRCQWSVVLNSCITKSCSSYTIQSDCTYVYTSYSPGDVALCYWDSVNNDCRSASLSLAETFNQTNTTQCYVNTGHVYHLDGNDCTRCFQNILSILLITVLLILI
ncbi:unnamed protein product [Paramecium primaurelia]|uniref:PSI domain-containing protein n=1 Tax=Paramecium primaurelia TaxID=5886 RepID=A0A8S1QE53_PARPR|nr:unnamed protein product [Paramecium primaurelia]